MISALNRLPDETIQLTITIPVKRTETSYQKALTDLAKQVTIKGFRQGKAPLKRVESHLGKQAVLEEAVKTLITEVYLEAVKEHGIKPIINPEVQVTSLQEGKEWQIIATTCELPKIELGDYKQSVREALAAEKIWLPGKDQAEPSPDKESKKLEKVFKALLASTSVKIPSILIKQDVDRRLSNLLDQTQKLGLTIDQYLSSKGKTKEQLRQGFENEAEETLRLELALSAIADRENIQISENEVEKMIKGLPDEKSRQSYDNPAQRTYLRQLLRKRAVIDKLNKL